MKKKLIFFVFKNDLKGFNDFKNIFIKIIISMIHQEKNEDFTFKKNKI